MSGGARTLILVADDNGDDFELLRTAFVPHGERVRLDYVPDGEQCLAYLRREGAHAGASTPDLLLLDINMPVKDGFQVMECIAADEALRALPVLVFTTSSAPDDIERMYRLRCNAFITKPLEFEDLQRVADSVVDFWLCVAQLPGRGSPRGHPTQFP